MHSQEVALTAAHVTFVPPELELVVGTLITLPLDEPPDEEEEETVPLLDGAPDDDAGVLPEGS